MRYSKVFLVLLVLVFAYSMAFASVGLKEEGSMLGAATDIDIVGVGITASGDYGGKTITLAGVATESDTYKTLTVAESGTTFVATGTDGIGSASRTFRLPDITASNDGVFYEFLNGTHSGASAPELNIDPGEHATIFLDGSQVDGESIRAQIGADSYPSIILKAFGGNWYVVSVGAPGLVANWTSGG